MNLFGIVSEVHIFGAPLQAASYLHCCPSRDRLKGLYKPKHNDSLANIPRFYMIQSNSRPQEPAR